MGTKRSGHNVRKETEESLPVPPGFVSLTSFTLKRINSRETANGIPKSICAPLSNSDIEKFKSSFWQRTRILHDQSDCLAQDFDTKLTEVEKNHTVSAPLPNGVIWGCPNCHDCVKVTARWRPEESHLPELDDAPVFHPTKEEFENTLEYIAKIRPQAENFGICRIVPPSWKLPCLSNDKRIWETTHFSTLVQRVNGLQNWDLEKRPEVCSRIGPDFTIDKFSKCAYDFKSQYFHKNGKVVDSDKEHVREQRDPLIARIEGEYWRIIENPSEEIEVLLGADSTCQTLGSGFPTRESRLPYSDYVESGWNLNNTAKLPSSLLQYGTSEMLVPQMSVGMCFASQCWRHEDHHLYSLSYLHLGDSKVWYGVPGRYCFKFMEVVRKLFPQLSNHPELLQKLVTQISPSKLMAEGIPVYRCVQNPSEFVLTFPSAYHSEFSCGFNCSEALRFAPFDWLPHGQNAVELYSGYSQKTSISHDMLLLRTAMEAVRAQWEFLVTKKRSIGDQLWSSACRKDGILTKALKARVKVESIRREHLCNVPSPKTLNEFDSANKMECSICQYDLYLSAVCCSAPSCSPNKYACLRHTNKLCYCSWGEKRFFFRYTIAELNLLVEALEGNIKAIHSWAKKAQSVTGSSVQNNALQNGTKICSDSENVTPVVCGANGEKAKMLPNQNVVVVLSDDEDE